MSTLQTILHPTDFSPEADYAFKVACSLAKDYGGRLVLLHVLRATVATVTRQPTPNPMEVAELQDTLRGKFPWPEPADASITVEHRIAEGDAAEEILRLANGLHCDLIVMGTHGRTGLNRLLTGSVAEEVVRQANCPVMTIRNPPAKPGARLPAPVKLLAQPGSIIDVRPHSSAPPAGGNERLAGSHGIEITRMHLPAGKEIYQYRTGGTIILHCLSGRLVITALGKTHTMEAGQLVFLPKDEPHTLAAKEDTILLMTVALPPL
jgi:nucleotide-binding universal stress UspA family protein/quercetin dioxygenase-like cupin family protein